MTCVGCQTSCAWRLHCVDSHKWIKEKIADKLDFLCGPNFTSDLKLKRGNHGTKIGLCVKCFTDVTKAYCTVKALKTQGKHRDVLADITATVGNTPTQEILQPSGSEILQPCTTHYNSITQVQ